MPKQHSAQREHTFKLYGHRFTKELQKLKGRDYFMVKDIGKEGSIKCLAHLSERTRNQYCSELCTELQVRGVLSRNGKTFYFRVRKRKEQS